MKIRTAAPWGEMCFSSEAFLERKALKLINVCAPQSDTQWECGHTQTSFLNFSISPGTQVPLQSPQLRQPLALGQHGVNHCSYLSKQLLYFSTLIKFLGFYWQ